MFASCSLVEIEQKSNQTASYKDKSTGGRDIKGSRMRDNWGPIGSKSESFALPEPFSIPFIPPSTYSHLRPTGALVAPKASPAPNQNLVLSPSSHLQPTTIFVPND